MQRLGLAGGEEGGDQGIVLALLVSGLLLVALGLTLVWLNIERTKLAYNLQVLQREGEKRLELNAKLAVEREHLLSPYVLGKKADAMGLHTPQSGQIRRMGAARTNGNATTEE